VVHGRQLLVLSIACKEYDCHDLAPLPDSVVDGAVRVKDALLKCGFKVMDSTLGVSAKGVVENPGKTALLAALRDAALSLRAGDVLVVYATGYGDSRRDDVHIPVRDLQVTGRD
jgi:hypothetical protein